MTQPQNPPARGFDRALSVTEIRHEWGDAIGRSCNTLYTPPERQLIVKGSRREPVAMLVPMGFYNAARRIIRGPIPTLSGSDQVRTNLSHVLNTITHAGVHWVILIEKCQVAALIAVPYMNDVLDTVPSIFASDPPAPPADGQGVPPWTL